ncbi:MAG: hypothetical protein QME94_13775, partial [Anaerolineae bacterium]|nr:hypothetical protein [Anaerolineae bacterium]
MTPGPRCRGLVEAGALATAILLPLWFNPLAATPFEPYKVAFFGAVAVGVAAVCGACWAWRRYKARVTGAAPVAGPQERNPLLWPILAYVAILLLATALSVNPALSFWGRAVSPHGAATSLAQAAFFLAVAAALEGSEQIERLQAAIVLGTVPVALYGI